MSFRLTNFGAFLLACLTTTMTSTVTAQESKDTDPIGYFLGVSVGQQMFQQGFKNGDFDVEALASGLSDALAGNKPALDSAVLQEASGKIEALLRSRQQERQKEVGKLAAANKKKGDEFLAANGKKEGVETTESGLQYKVIKEGDGGSPTLSDTVQVHYTGKLINDEVFDSSVQRGEPATFRVGQVIKGWQEGLQKMKVGSKWMIYIPSDLAYGPDGRPGAIGPNEVLVFEVELLDIP
jgi:FKBP-type peptidyl-prolyl cis-trans isomerase FklB